MLFCLCAAAPFCELSLKAISPHGTVGICHFPSSQRGQLKSKLQFESHRGNSVILLTCIIPNPIRQVRWPDVAGFQLAVEGPRNQGRSQRGWVDLAHLCGGHRGDVTKSFKCQAKLARGENRAGNLPRHLTVFLSICGRSDNVPGM